MSYVTSNKVNLAQSANWDRPAPTVAGTYGDFDQAVNVSLVNVQAPEAGVVTDIYMAVRDGIAANNPGRLKLTINGTDVLAGIDPTGAARVAGQMLHWRVNEKFDRGDVISLRAGVKGTAMDGDGSAFLVRGYYRESNHHQNTKQNSNYIFAGDLA